MQRNSIFFNRIQGFFRNGLDLVEFAGLLVIGFATTVAMYQEVIVMIAAHKVALTDLLMMFLFLEVLAMISHYFTSGQLPVRFPLYIAMVALARYLILDAKEITEWRMLAVSGSILLLTLAVLAVRYGHVRFPYEHDGEKQRPYVRE